MTGTFISDRMDTDRQTDRQTRQTGRQQYATFGQGSAETGTNTETRGSGIREICCSSQTERGDYISTDINKQSAYHIKIYVF